ncbi:MAG: tyrosine-protein phosphatase [Parahaliea sp.]
MNKLTSSILVATMITSPCFANIDKATSLQKNSGATATYKRVLTLEGGSNFRDMGGYTTEDGKLVRRGLLYRSGVMTALTPQDEQYLAGFGFDSIIDLRSNEERDLYPNYWAKNAGINYVSFNYSFTEIMKKNTTKLQKMDMSSLYRQMPYNLKKQLKNYFELAIEGSAPLVVNCSAGQDRTGIASALMLSALGVPRPQIVQDYILSTEYRRPNIEKGNIDLKASAQTNAFARIMLRYADKQSIHAAPLITDQGIPYLYYAFEQIESDYGSVQNYLEKELDVDAVDINTLKQHYLQ